MTYVECVCLKINVFAVIILYIYAVFDLIIVFRMIVMALFSQKLYWLLGYNTYIYDASRMCVLKCEHNYVCEFDLIIVFRLIVFVLFGQKH